MLVHSPIVDLDRESTYHRTRAAVFFRAREEHGGLSNMAGGFPLLVNDLPIRTSEALYQACRFPLRPDLQRLIMGEASPLAAKWKARAHLELTRPDWDDQRVVIMDWCLRVKLAQHWERFGSLLLATAERPIVERSRRDAFWGAKLLDDETLVGQNVLGKLLTNLREQLRSAQAVELRQVAPLVIPDFRLDDRPIGPLGELR
jgi:type I restriction enzyme, S subunit